MNRSERRVVAFNGRISEVFSRIRGPRRVTRILLVLAAVLSGASCDVPPEGEIEYRPVVLPVKFSLSSSGISITGEKTLVTPIGMFSIGAKYSLPEKNRDTIYVVIRDRNERPIGFDHTYQVRSGAGEFTAVVNGTTTIQVVDRQVLIDVTDSTVQSIEFKTVEPPVSEQGDDVAKRLLSRWDSYWNDSFYTPFDLFNWAYDDSTMTKWYGVGFAWFLLRLVAALILLIPDLLLSLLVLVAGLAYVLIGTTGRNIVYGLGALIVLFCVVGGIAAARDF